MESGRVEYSMSRMIDFTSHGSGIIPVTVASKGKWRWRLGRVRFEWWGCYSLHTRRWWAWWGLVRRMHRKSPPPITLRGGQPLATRQDVKMEDDRAQTNLGPAAEDGVPEEAPAATKQPRRRFVGRKKTAAAGAAVGSVADANTSIEDSSAIQGVRQPWTPSRHVRQPWAD